MTLGSVTDAVRPARSPSPRNELLLWALLATAFSPVLVDLAGHLAAEPWSVYPAAFVALFVRETLRSGHGPSHPRLACALLCGGLLLELLMVRAGWPRMARPGWVAAAFGLTLLVGRPSPWLATLILWWIPVPHALVSLAHPHVAYGLATPAVQIAAWLGVETSFELLRGAKLVAHLGAATLPLTPADAGIPLAVALGGLGWLSALERGREPRRAVLSAASAALAAAPIQALVLGAAVALAAFGAPGAGRTWLDASVALVTGAGLCRVWRLGDGSTPR